VGAFSKPPHPAQTTESSFVHPHKLIPKPTNHEEASMARTVQCIKLGREAEGLDFPPTPGELGKRIYENVSKEAWAAWLKHQTMLVNENRLNLADQRAREYLKRQMENHFFGSGADAAAGYVPPTT
jgi:Fe-S cluster biosynthesis and repair protein YggX